MPARRNASLWVMGAGTALTLVYAAQLTSALSDLASLLVGAGCCLVQVVSLRVNRPAVRAPWLLMTGACFLFLIGVIVRPWAVAQPGIASSTADVFTFGGYALLAVGLSLFLRWRTLVRHALTDGVIVCVGAATLAIDFLALPAARISDRPELVSVTAGIYPLWDVVVLLLVLNIGFSSAARLASFRYVAASVSCLLVGDLAYAWIGTRGQLTGSPLLDTPFLIGFTFLGAAAMHPSRARFSSVAARPVQSWSFPRLALIIPALAAPAIVLLAQHHDTGGAVLPAAASLALMAGLLLRALSAVRSQAEQQRGLLHQATHDGLTGLPNRILILERVTDLLREESVRNTGTWLLFLDLDGFKLVNDHWGHEMGDELLRAIAIRLQHFAGESCVVARMSGDEFALAGAGSLGEAIGLADRIHCELAAPVEIRGIELVVSGSIGVVARTEQLTAEALLRDADLAMYRAKADGRNRWQAFDVTMRQVVRDRVETEMALRYALTQNQLWMSYQPIVDCRTGRVAGAEALLRWTHPTRGPIPPAEFIPVAEATGLIEEIGEFVLTESVAQLARWRDTGILPPDFNLSINVSARQLYDGTLPGAVAAALSRHSLNGGQLSLELTESIMLGNSMHIADMLAELRDLGVGLSVDDFGTGYSSLSYLSRFPVTAVKIDRSFVQGLGSDAGDEAIARAVVAMASALDLLVIAEGVETEEQRDGLCGLDVVLAQGWLWGRAEAAETFAEKHLGGQTSGDVRAVQPAQGVQAEVVSQAGSGNS